MGSSVITNLDRLPNQTNPSDAEKQHSCFTMLNFCSSVVGLFQLLIPNVR